VRNPKLRMLLAAIAALTAASVLAACGGDDSVGGGNEGEVQTAEGGTPSGDLMISNWPGYIDKGSGNTIDKFEEEYGVSVEYLEDVDSNTGFFGKFQPQLEQGESGGRSIFVLTDWMANRMYELGYLQEIDHADLPTVFENLSEQFQASTYDPDRKYSIPWQSGMTGIWVDKSEAGDIESVNDLFDPKYKGRVTMLDEMRDTVPLVMKADGIDPEEATKEDWLAAIEKIDAAADSGQIRRFTGNGYTEDITSGNAVASIGWSGDAYLIGNKDAEWRMPTDGCILWTDNVVIPVGAPNTAAALAWTDFAYRPEVQADIAAFVNYVTPVDGVKEILAEGDDPSLAENPLIFPDEQFTENCTYQVDPPGNAEDRADVEEAFQEVVAG
jgi:spermidine/putrescine transport system substrate-binding protein